MDQWTKKIRFNDGNRKTEKSKNARRERNLKKASLKARFSGNHWLNQRKGDGPHQRAGTERKRGAPDAKAGWIAKTRRDEIGWVEERSCQDYDARGRGCQSEVGRSKRLQEKGGEGFGAEDCGV
jgi:hypothetical protein